MLRLILHPEKSIRHKYPENVRRRDNAMLALSLKNRSYYRSLNNKQNGIRINVGSGCRGESQRFRYG